MRIGLTFDDVLLVPQRSTILPNEVDVRSRLTRNIDLSIPIMSAAMDTVTEAEMAIAMAKEGGIGVIHRNLSPEAQAQEVMKVKRYESGVIKDPITLTKDEPVGKALKLMREQGISGVPIVKRGSDELEGLITIRDLQFQVDFTERIENIMTKREDLVTAPPDIGLEKAKRILHKHRIEKLPLVDGGFKLRGLITIKDIKKAAEFPDACKDSRGQLIVGAAVGTEVDMRREEGLLEAEVDFLVVDTAHGHSERVLEKTRAIKQEFDIDVIAGNVVTPEAVADLAAAGADAIKVGVGAGAICTTRVVAGIGVPQFSATLDCAQEAKRFDLPLIADGGIRSSGDIAKAIAAGADAVMIGGLLAGTREAPGELFTLKGETYKSYRGMGSIAAMKEGSKARYFWLETEEPIAEGIEGRVKYKGELAEVLYQLVGGLRSSMGYCGAPDIRSLQERAEFIQVTRAGLIESHPHDVQITKEAPNYRFA